MPEIKLSTNQLKTLNEALDIITRLYSGQVDELNKIAEHQIDKETLDQLKKRMFPCLKNNSFHGITSLDINYKAKVLYDIHQVIRHYLSWKDQSNTPENRDWVKQLKVDFDEPLKTSDEPLAKIRSNKES